MRWTRTLQLADVHCEGEIGRVVIGGLIDVPGRSMAEKLRHINEVDDSLRTFLTREPRGGPAGSVVLLTAPTRAEADVGLIVLQSDQAHAMSGSNAMCAATALLETGMVQGREPETVVTFDTAVGLVKAVASCRDGRCEAVSLDMPPSFVERLDAAVSTDAWGQVTYDIAFGGVFYALVDVEQIGLTIAPDKARDLATAGVTLLERINAEVEVRHRSIPEVHGVAYVMFREAGGDGVLKTCTTLMPGRVDRSPCGTGSNANMAATLARGGVRPGEARVSRSIIGSRFLTELLGVVDIDGIAHARTRITGRSWLYGLSQVGLDPTDPFPNGFVLSDTWGPLVDAQARHDRT